MYKQVLGPCIKITFNKFTITKKNYNKTLEDHLTHVNQDIQELEDE